MMERVSNAAAQISEDNRRTGGKDFAPQFGNIEQVMEKQNPRHFPQKNIWILLLVRGAKLSQNGKNLEASNFVQHIIFGMKIFWKWNCKQIK